MGIRIRDLPPALRKKLGLETPSQRNKYGAKRQVVGELAFDSQREAARYQALTYRQRAGEIENLQCQPVFYITRDGQVIARYTADFRYWDRRTRGWRVEDVKGGQATRTEAYRLRKRLVEAQYAIEIEEV